MSIRLTRTTARAQVERAKATGASWVKPYIKIPPVDAEAIETGHAAGVPVMSYFLFGGSLARAWTGKEHAFLYYRERMPSTAKTSYSQFARSGHRSPLLSPSSCYAASPSLSIPRYSTRPGYPRSMRPAFWPLRVTPQGVGFPFRLKIASWQ